jgi:hypothetical protein
MSNDCKTATPRTVATGHQVQVSLGLPELRHITVSATDSFAGATVWPGTERLITC